LPRYYKFFEFEYGVKKCNFLMNKSLIVANWKMNPATLKESKRLFNSVKEGIKNVKNTEVVICPPFIYLPVLKSEAKGPSFAISFGGQSCFWEEKGAFTGEVSPTMLKGLGCQYVILGHSERRKYFQETDEMINKKIKAALKAKLKPILCIGETESEKKSGKTLYILKKQLTSAFKNTPKSLILNSKFSIAYEPIWAIGTGNFCDPLKAKKILLFLRKTIKKNPILYGGSVNSQNARDYIKVSGFQGLLVGGASLDAKEFIKIVKSVGY